MPRLKSESDGIFSEPTACIFSQFAGLPSWQFASSEISDKPDKRHVNIDTDRIAAFLGEYRPDASKLIFSAF